MHDARIVAGLFVHSGSAQLNHRSWHGFVLFFSSCVALMSLLCSAIADSVLRYDAHLHVCVCVCVCVCTCHNSFPMRVLQVVCKYASVFTECVCVCVCVCDGPCVQAQFVQVFVCFCAGLIACICICMFLHWQHCFCVRGSICMISCVRVTCI